MRVWGGHVTGRFPTSFSYVHAGYPPVSGDKYNVISFITIPNPL
jgi:hypothetical protein